MRLAFTGPRYAGKSTLADYLRDEHGVTVLHYNDAIKDLLCTGLNAIEERLMSQLPSGTVRPIHSMTGILQNKALYRPLLQDLGSFYGFNKGFYVREMLNQWKAIGSPEPVIWDNVRFPEQFELLRDEGFVLVEFLVSENVQLERAQLLGVSEEEFYAQGQHEAEDGVEGEMYLDGEMETEVQADILLRMFGLRRLPRLGRTAPISRQIA